VEHWPVTDQDQVNLAAPAPLSPWVPIMVLPKTAALASPVVLNSRGNAKAVGLAGTTPAELAQAIQDQGKGRL
jgi:hypothetical protein